MLDTPDTLAAEIRLLLEQGDEQAAVTRAVEGYGPEVMGFLQAMVRDPDAADDVFSEVCEDVWRGLSSFRWEAPLRAWVYTIARHAALRHFRRGHERRRRPLDDALAVGLVAEMRTRTRTWARTEARTAVDRLREQLTPEERALLVLRLDRKLAWSDIAQVMSAPEGETLSAEQARKESAMLRKRFERVKERLKALAKAEGLLSDDG